MSQSMSSRKTPPIPDWGQKAANSTEKLMETFYAPAQGSEVRGERVRSHALTGRDKTSRVDQVKEQPMQPLSLSLEDEAQSLETSAPIALETASQGHRQASAQSGAVETVTEPDTAANDRRPRARSVLPRRKTSLVAVERVYSAPTALIAALDPVLIALFPGRSMSVYKALFERTIGATVPVDSINATKQELSSWSGISHRHTLIKHIQHLTAVKLIKRLEFPGDPTGPVYSVRRLEEVGVPIKAAESFYRIMAGQPEDRARAEGEKEMVAAAS